MRFVLPALSEQTWRKVIAPILQRHGFSYPTATILKASGVTTAATHGMPPEEPRFSPPLGLLIPEGKLTLSVRRLLFEEIRVHLDHGGDVICFLHDRASIGPELVDLNVKSRGRMPIVQYYRDEDLRRTAELWIPMGAPGLSPLDLIRDEERSLFFAATTKNYTGLTAMLLQPIYDRGLDLRELSLSIAGPVAQVKAWIQAPQNGSRPPMSSAEASALNKDLLAVCPPVESGQVAVATAEELLLLDAATRKDNTRVVIPGVESVPGQTLLCAAVCYSHSAPIHKVSVTLRSAKDAPSVVYNDIALRIGLGTVQDREEFLKELDEAVQHVTKGHQARIAEALWYYGIGKTQYENIIVFSEERKRLTDDDEQGTAAAG